MDIAETYPGVCEAHLAVARSLSSPLLNGPPLSPELIAFVEHLFTPDEALLAAHLKPWRPRTASSLARAADVSGDEAARILGRLAHEKYVVLGMGSGKSEMFALLPVLPGIFESALMRPSEDMLTDWHRRLAELFEALYDTGFVADYISEKRSAPFIRYIPVGEVIEALPSALPGDRLEPILERYDRFAIMICQCRVSKKLSGDYCGRMIETCTAFGDVAGRLVREGKGKSATRRDVIDVKRAAEADGLVTWMFNVGRESRLNGSCSCCGCCCAALRSITQLETPGMIAPAHFMPVFDESLCSWCRKCASACQTHAITILEDGDRRELSHREDYCIGCGLCAAACDRGAVTLRAVDGYEEPSATWVRWALKSAPAAIGNVRRVRRMRRGATPHQPRGSFP